MKKVKVIDLLKTNLIYKNLACKYIRSSPFQSLDNGHSCKVHKYILYSIFCVLYLIYLLHFL